MSKKISLCGQRFGRLVVLCENGRAGDRSVLWLCKCDCGAEVIVTGGHLRSGHTTSCGCYRRERTAEVGNRNTVHGMRNSRLYKIWQGILQRTGITKGANERVKRDYIDRGITVCTEWKTFENFRDWSFTHGYSDNLEIDRIDNDCGYLPGNCRWVTRKENTNNRRCTLRLPDGTSLADFCTACGIETTRENGKMSKQYARIRQVYSRRHKAHPELLAKANDLIALYKKTLELRKLLAEVKQLASDVQKLLQRLNPESA